MSFIFVKRVIGKDFTTSGFESFRYLIKISVCYISYFIRNFHDSKLPLQIQIETNNTCTRKCWFCKFSQVRQDPGFYEMSGPLFETILSQLKQLNFRGRVCLYGINEPLMDPHLLYRIKKLRLACPSAFLTLDTNGDLLNHELIEALDAAGLDGLMINAYDTPALKRMAEFRSHRIVTVCDSRGKDQRVENRGGSILRKTHLFDPQKFQQNDCQRPSTALQINVKGDVVLCCGDMYGDVVFGNIQDQQITDIWMSDKLVSWRRQLKENGRKGLTLCDGCSHDGTASFRVPMAIRKTRIKRRLIGSRNRESRLQ